MGWKDLFKSKTPKTQPDPRLRWFGKLPTYADYYSSPTDEEWAVEFNDWVLKGFEAYLTRRTDRPRAVRLPAAACIVRLPKSGMTVLASVQDYGGDMRGRPFPLCFYVGLPSAHWPGPTADRALPALRLLHDLAALRDQVFRFFNAPGRFEVVFGGRDFDLSRLDGEASDDSWRTVARKLGLADWFAAARTCLKIEELATWLRVATDWGASIARLESEEFGPTFRFPLAATLPLEIQVPGWLRWLEHRMNLAERFLSVLYCRDAAGETNRLSVVARELVSEDFLLMTAAAGTLTYVDDMCLLGSEVGAAAASAQAVAGPPNGPGPAPENWADFVDASPSSA